MITMLLGLLPGKAKMIGILVAAMVVASAIGYHFYTVSSLEGDLFNTREDLAKSIVNQERLEGAVSDLKQSRQLLETQRKIDQEKLNNLAVQYKESRKKVGNLRKLLSKHDIGHLMLNKPGLMENRFNKGTDAFGKELEELTSD